MIRIITDGALPLPAKCASCGSSETTNRVYVDFKYFDKRVNGRILVCSTCMEEAARSPYLNFVALKDYHVLEKLYRDQCFALNVSAEAIEGFQRDFTDLVDRFTSNLAYAVYDNPDSTQDSNQIFDSEIKNAAPDDNEIELSGGTIFDTESDEPKIAGTGR